MAVGRRLLNLKYTFGPLDPQVMVSPFDEQEAKALAKAEWAEDSKHSPVGMLNQMRYKRSPAPAQRCASSATRESAVPACL